MGTDLRIFCLASRRILAPPPRTTGGSSRRCGGCREPAPRGALGRRRWVTGTRRTCASRAGTRPACGNGCWRRSVATPAWKKSSSTAPPSAPTGMPRALPKKRQALGRSRGGFGTKIHLIADALGHPPTFRLTAAQAAGITQAQALRASMDPPAAVIADTGYDADAFIQASTDMGAHAVIPVRRNRHQPRSGTRIAIAPVIGSNTGSRASSNSAASPPAMTRPLRISPPSSCSLAPAYGWHDC